MTHKSKEHHSESANPLVNQFPVVGIGASAGGLAAFEAFFSGMPPKIDPNMAFVLVQHLDPNHKSILTELIQRKTRMKVFEVTDGIKVQINCAYIIPPGHDMAILNGTLQLLEQVTTRGLRLPIDFFFRSLAQDQHERAIGIILSGTGSDGTQGLRAIKAEGGMVMVQAPEAEYDGMPQSALATGLVDFQLAPTDMPAQLISYTSHAFGKPFHQTPLAESLNGNALTKIYVLLRAQTSHDFSKYKPSTIHRRISRRMAVHQTDSLDAYLKLLQQNTKEVDALFRDLLIGVTNFFRDAEAFPVLESQIIPQLFAGKPPGSEIRIWSAGCSTGEEAYSLAILLVEHMEIVLQNYVVKVFATDIDSMAIAAARRGTYPASIANNVSPIRLARFFTTDTGEAEYHIHRKIRDLVIFSEQDLIKDPPFSKLDLISCRNLMIYFDVELQKKVIPMFHFSLCSAGFLFLGTSETVGEFTNHFVMIDRKAKIYQKKNDLHSSQREALDRLLPPTVNLFPGHTRMADKHSNFPVKLPLRELTEQTLLQQIAPAGALVNAKGDILYLHGRTGRYLEPTPGEAQIHNILKMAREGLLHTLATALHKAVAGKETVRCPGLRVKTNGHFTQVNLSIHPVVPNPAAAPSEPLFLVILEDAPEVEDIVSAEGTPPSDSPNPNPSAQLIAALQFELRAKDEYLQSTTEELEAANEELKSANEELQSVNEELQSTNEELETSKEELQSVNEELSTVNTELQNKVNDLSRSNNDMNNLLAGTGIGTVFVDHELRILRFTPAVTRIINLIHGDLNRHVSHVVSNLVGYTSMVADTQAVLNTLIPKEIDVQTVADEWYKMRIVPYRTLDNVIEGAVITFMEITEIKRIEMSLRKVNEIMPLAIILRDSVDAVVVQDLDGRITAWNPAAVHMYGWTENEALTMNVRDRIPAGKREEALAKVRLLSEAKVLEPYLTERSTKDGRILDISLVSTALMNETGQMYGIATTERLKKSNI